MLLLSLICIALFSAIHLSTTAWRRAAAPLESSLERHAVAAFMRRQFAQLHAVFARVDGDERAMFVGSEDRVRFVSPLPAHRGVAGLHVVEFRIAPRGALELGYTLYRPDRHTPLDQAELSVAETLIEGLGEASFAYAGTDAGNGMDWSAAWVSAERFPSVVGLIEAGTEPSASGWRFAVHATDSRFRVVDPVLPGGTGRPGDEPAGEPAAAPVERAGESISGRGRGQASPSGAADDGFVPVAPNTRSLGPVPEAPVGIQTFTREPEGVGERGEPRCGTELQC